MPAPIFASAFAAIIVIIFVLGVIALLVVRFLLPRRRSDTSPHPQPVDEVSDDDEDAARRPPST